MRRWMMVAVVLVADAVAVGCDKDESFVTADEVRTEINGAVDVAAPKCTPGLVQDCPCPMGALGVQTCADDGKRWGACTDCWSALPPSSGSGGAATSQTIQCDQSTLTAVALYPGVKAEDLSAVRVFMHQNALPKQAPFSTTNYSIWDGKVEAACLGDYDVFILP